MKGFYIYFLGTLSHSERWGKIKLKEKPSAKEFLEGYREKEYVKFISFEDIEKKYGKIIAILDKCEDEELDSCTYPNLIIWTTDYVLTIYETSLGETLIAHPRNPPR